MCCSIFEQCVQAVIAGELIESASARDKEFHFQDWFQARLEKIEAHYDAGGRNTYPDFSLVEYTEGYEVKGLAWPGRERDYDSNSQVPTGSHNGRRIFYVFGRYPADLKPYEVGGGRRQYPVVDLVVCHGDFLNADHNYVHKNKNVKLTASSSNSQNLAQLTTTDPRSFSRSCPARTGSIYCSLSISTRSTIPMALPRTRPSGSSSSTPSTRAG